MNIKQALHLQSRPLTRWGDDNALPRAAHRGRPIAPTPILTPALTGGAREERGENSPFPFRVASRHGQRRDLNSSGSLHATTCVGGRRARSVEASSKLVFSWLIVIPILLIALGGCTPAATLVPPTTAPTLPPAASAAPSPTTAVSVTLTDDANRMVTIAAPPQRILSLAPSTTEIVFALGLGNRVIAVDTFSDFPADVKSLPKVNTSPMSFEQIVSLRPDLVLAAGLQTQDDVKKLSDLNLTVLVVGSASTTFDGVASDIDLVARATGTLAQAKSVTDAMAQKVSAIKATIAKAQSRPRVYWELDSTDPSNPYVPGPGSFIDDIIVLAGGINVAADVKTPYAQINAEQVISDNPALIILSDVAYGTTIESVKARKGWNVISAVKNNKVFPIDDNLVSRPGPRIADGLEAAARLIHPELFP